MLRACVSWSKQILADQGCMPIEIMFRLFMPHRLSKMRVGLPRTAERRISSDGIFKKLSSGDRPQIARAITLIESEREDDKQLAQSLVSLCIKANEKQQNETRNIRIGKICCGLTLISIIPCITGPPGAGKSCFIEAFGEYLISSRNKKVSVLTIDPSSSRTGGSLLGDKTRMYHLSRNPAAYIRSSPAAGQLGGVCKTTSDSIELLQAAGFNVTIVETVGVGQSEFKIQDMCDCLILLIPPGGGDELQAVKKGIVEVCDIICVTKFDGNHLPEARRVGSEYMSASKFIRPKSKMWRPRVLMTSAKEGIGLEKLWLTVEKFLEAIGSQNLVERRAQQRVANMWTYLQEDFLRNAKQTCHDFEDEVRLGNMTPAQGSRKVMEALCDFRRSSELFKKESSI